MVKIDNLVLSKRKTITLVVEADGSLTVRAPKGLSRKRIQAVVDEKAGWIAEKQAVAQRLKPPLRRYEAGEMLLFLGQEYPLLRPEGESCRVTFDGKRFLMPAGCADPVGACEAWYRAAARRVLQERVAKLASQHGFTYKKLRISGARTRWGSCSTSGTLSFTWRLVMAPPAAVDYVVLHELAHIDHPNHSPAFWQRVGELVPDYKDQLKWFHQHGAALRL
jgi:predicted metal-dependent hydrolase